MGTGYPKRTGLRRMSSATSSSEFSRDAATGEYHARAEQFEDARLAQVVAEELHQFTRTRLENFSQHALLHHTRRPVSYRWHFDLVAHWDSRHDGAAKHLLDDFQRRKWAC